MLLNKIVKCYWSLIHLLDDQIMKHSFLHFDICIADPIVSL